MIKLEKGRKRSKNQIVTVNLPIWMIEIVNVLINAGATMSRSELVRFAIQSYLLNFFDKQGKMILNYLETRIIDEDIDLIDPPAFKDITELREMCKEAKTSYVQKLLKNGGIEE